MKCKAILLNCLNYKKDGKVGTRIGFVLCDHNDENDRFKGCSELSVFYNTDAIFNKIPKEMLLTPVDVTLRAISSFKNPLKSTLTIESISCNGRTVNIL